MERSLLPTRRLLLGLRAKAKLDAFEMPRLRSTDCAELILNILGASPTVTRWTRLRSADDVSYLST